MSSHWDHRSLTGTCRVTAVISIIWCTFVLILLSTLNSVQCQFVEIQTELGRIRGVRFQTQLNNPAIGFLGIPYALPPIGERRFKKSSPYPKWAPKTLMAANYKSCCPQLDMNGVPHGAEDCLYLNVFVPLHNIDQSQFSLGGKRFPVMVYFQGESFENGDAALYGAEKLLDWEVILVTFNYRLGVLGFLSTGDEHASGNWGLYDQLTVLQWIRQHIESFSGNPNSVTIFGQGAGASSAFLHLVSPLSTGLFHRVIAQSGSPLCSWSMENEPENAAHEMALRLGCPTELGNLEVVRCLRKAPLGRLLASQQQGKIFGEYPHRMLPVVELSGAANDRLVSADPRVLLRQGNYRRVPLMMGYNRDETAFLYPLILNKQFIGDSSTLRAFLEEKLLPRFIRANILDRNSFTDAMSTNSAKLKSYRSDIERDIANNILFRYFNFMNGRNYTDLATRFVNMSTDALYGACIDETVRLYSAGSGTAGNPFSPHSSSKSSLLLPFGNITYKYVFQYRSRNSMLSLILSGNHQNRQSFNRNFAQPLSLNSDFSHTVSSAVCHGDELFHLFALKFASRKPDDNRDLLAQRLMLSLWTDFAKHGFAPINAGAEIPYWPSYTSAKPSTYLIDGQISVLERYGDSSTHFWTRYLPSIASNSASASIVARPPHSDKLDNGLSGTSGRDNGYYYDRTSVARLRTFAWSMLALSTILLLLIFVLVGLLYYQRRKQTFSAESRQKARQTSARALARALATSARQTGSTSTSALY